MPGRTQQRHEQSTVDLCAGGTLGQLEVVRINAITGEALPLTPRLSVVNGDSPEGRAGDYCLRGVVSNERYLNHTEKVQLGKVQQLLGRETAQVGALIPIKKTDAWWSPPQDEIASGREC